MNDVAVARAAVDVLRDRAANYNSPSVQPVLTLSGGSCTVVCMSTNTPTTSRSRTGARPGRVRNRTTYQALGPITLDEEYAWLDGYDVNRYGVTVAVLVSVGYEISVSQVMHRGAVLFLVPDGDRTWVAGTFAEAMVAATNIVAVDLAAETGVAEPTVAVSGNTDDLVAESFR